MSQESKTPRTDAKAWKEGSMRVVSAGLARQLETELAEVTAERDAFIASARIREANAGWRPIETVDHGSVLLCTTYGAVVIDEGQYVIALLADAEKNGEACVFCGWMPLPAPLTTEPEQ